MFFFFPGKWLSAGVKCQLKKLSCLRFSPTWTLGKLGMSSKSLRSSRWRDLQIRTALKDSWTVCWQTWPHVTSDESMAVYTAYYKRYFYGNTGHMNTSSSAKLLRSLVDQAGHNQSRMSCKLESGMPSISGQTLTSLGALSSCGHSTQLCSCPLKKQRRFSAGKPAVPWYVDGWCNLLLKDHSEYREASTISSQCPSLDGSGSWALVGYVHV